MIMSDLPYFNFENKLKKGLSKNNLTIDAFAEKSGISRATLYNLFKSNNVSTKVLAKCSEILNMDIIDWFKSDETNLNMANEGKVNYIKADFKEFNNSKIHITLDECRHKVELLEKELEGLKKEINLKNEIIEILKGMK